MTRFLLIGFLIAVNVLIFSTPTRSGLSVSFLDVGQGDAILIQGPHGRILVDGGATRAVLRALSSTLPFFDRTLDVIVATHPDQDHIGGFPDVVSRYRVGTFIESGVLSDTPAFHALEKIVSDKNIVKITARRGMRILLGGGAHADILFPDRDVSRVETNTASVIMRVVYGESEFLLTGDSPRSIERYLFEADGAHLQSDVLKAGHHGSKTSSDEAFVKAVSPQYVVYSRGCDNRYGHPAPEVVELFKTLSIPAFDTCESGTVTFRSNGKTLRVAER